MLSTNGSMLKREWILNLLIELASIILYRKLCVKDGDCIVSSYKLFMAYNTITNVDAI